jgi:uncharacterized membrane protein
MDNSNNNSNGNQNINPNDVSDTKIKAQLVVTRAIIKVQSPRVLITSFWWFLVTTAVSLLQSYVSGASALSSALMPAMEAYLKTGVFPAPDELNALVRQHFSVVGSLLALGIGILMSVAATGFAWYCLRTARGEKIGFREVFRSFERFTKVLWLQILRGILVAAQLLLLIVPGFIAVFRYSQAEYIMYDHPEYGVWRCLQESAKLMRGHKAQYFLMKLYFVGWSLLSYISSALLVIPILDVWVNLYAGVGFGVFYRCMTNGEPIKTGE